MLDDDLKDNRTGNLIKRALEEAAMLELPPRKSRAKDDARTQICVCLHLPGGRSSQRQDSQTLPFRNVG